MSRSINILSIEDSTVDFLLIKVLLDRADLLGNLCRVDTLIDLDAALESRHWDLLLADFNVPGMEFDEACALVRRRTPELPIIVVSGALGEEKVVELLKSGMTDFILKDNLGRLPLAIERAIVDAERQRDQAAAHAALSASEAKLWQILRTSQDGIWTVGLDARTTLVNPAMARMMGYSEAEMIGRPIADFVDARGEEMAMETLARLHEGPPGAMDGVMRRKDGENVWVTVNTGALTNGHGEMIGAVAVVSDNTKRRLAEATMRLQSAALEASADAVVIADVSGAILWVNRAFEVLTGYTAQEAHGRNPRELTKSGVHDAAFYKQMWDTLLAHQVWRGELINRRKDGSHYPEEMTITPVVNTAGEIESFVAIKRDLTAKKGLETQLLQAQKMESVGRLAGGIAHDFNNLLTVINGVSELALESLADGDSRRKDLQEIHHAGERAASLTRQLLAFSRKQIVKPEALDLNTLVTGTQSMLKRMIGEDIAIVTQPWPRPIGIKSDIGQLEQILMNLVINARDAMPAGGTLTIATRHEQLTAVRGVNGGTIGPGPYGVLEVTDTGTGMDEHTLAHVFDPFFTTKEVGKGTGLGLSTVYGIVQQWHGGLTVTSHVGQGSTFSIYLPYSGDAAAASASSTRGAGGSETILIVEDEEEVRVTSQRMIRAAGYDVFAVANASEALLVLEHHDHQIDLLLTDVVMPGMSGPELVEQVAAQRPEIAVLYMSGHSDNPALLRSISEAERRLITKPFSAAELTQAVRLALDSRAAATAGAAE